MPISKPTFDERMDEILKAGISRTLTLREISEGEKTKVHPYWVYVNGKLFAFDFNLSSIKPELRTLFKEMCEEVIGEKEYYYEHFPFVRNKEMQREVYELRARDELKIDQHTKLATILEGSK